MLVDISKHLLTLISKKIKNEETKHTVDVILGFGLMNVQNPLNRLLKLTFGKVSYSIFSVVAQLVCLCIFKPFSTTF